MSTKNDGMTSLSDKQQSFQNAFTDNSDDRYSNINLNQNYKCSGLSLIDHLGPFPKRSLNAKLDHIGRKRILKSWKNTNSTFINPSNYYNANNNGDEKVKKQWNKDTSNGNNSSTLSLHITAYENLIEGDVGSFGGENEGVKEAMILANKKWKRAKQICSSSSIIQNPFEFPRQQENEAKKPELMQFKGSQKLLNPNSTALTPDGDPTPLPPNGKISAFSMESAQSYIKEDYAFNKPALLDSNSSPSFIPSNYVWERLSETSIESTYKKKTAKQMDEEALAYLTAEIDPIFTRDSKPGHKLTLSFEKIFLGKDDDGWLCAKNYHENTVAVKIFSIDANRLQFYPNYFTLKPQEIQPIRIWKTPECAVETHFDIGCREIDSESTNLKQAFANLHDVEFVTVFIYDKLPLVKALPVTSDFTELHFKATGESRTLKLTNSNDERYAVKGIINEESAAAFDLSPDTVYIESEGFAQIHITRKCFDATDAILTLKMVEATNSSMLIQDVEFSAENLELVIKLKSS